jgi:hypothetical protein
MAKTLRYTATEVIRALEQTKGMVYLAAKQLGCAPETVQNYCHRYASVQAAKDAQRGTFLRIFRSTQKKSPLRHISVMGLFCHGEVYFDFV